MGDIHEIWRYNVHNRLLDIPGELAMAAEERDFEPMASRAFSHTNSKSPPWPGGGELPKMYYDVMDPFVSLASAASVTKKIKLATGYVW